MGASGYGPYDNDTAADCMHDINEELMGYISKADDDDILFCLMDVYFSMPLIHYRAKNTFNKYVPILYGLDEDAGWDDKKLRKETIDQYVEKWKQTLEDWGCEEIDDEE
jgi:hypothetical protein